MRKTFAFISAIVVVMFVFPFQPIGSYSMPAQHDYNQITPKAIEWIESHDDSGTNMVLKGYAGQKARADFTVFNRDKKAREFVFSYEIADIGNRDFITAEDRKSFGFSFGKVMVESGGKKTLSAFVTIPKNHCSSMLFIINARSGAEKGSISLYLCQYDSKEDMEKRVRPAKYGNYATLARNRRKVGRVLRFFGSMFVVYSNRFIFCYDEKKQNLKWFVEAEEFHDVGIFENHIYTDGFCLETKTGKNRDKGGQEGNNFYYHNFRHCFEDKAFLVFVDLSVGNGDGLHSVVCLNQADGEGFWITPSYAYFWNFNKSFTMPKVPGKIFYYLNPFEFFCNELACLDTSTGKYLFRIGPSSRYIQRNDQALLITTGNIGIEKSNEHIDVWDCQTNKTIYHHEELGSVMFVDNGKVSYFADYKCTGAYDYVSKKLLWKNPGDGAILADPLLDPSGNYIYILDADSVWKSKDYGYEMTKQPTKLRLFKFESETGKLVWKVSLFNIPKGSKRFENVSNTLEVKNGVITANIYPDWIGGKETPLYVFKVRASDGKPAR